MSGFGRIVLLGAMVATVAGISGLRAQTQLADPRDAPDLRLDLFGLSQEPAGAGKERTGRRLPAPALHDRPRNERRDGGLSGRRRQRPGQQGREKAAAAGQCRRRRPRARSRSRPRPSRRPCDANDAAHAARQAVAGEVARRRAPSHAHPAPASARPPRTDQAAAAAPPRRLDGDAAPRRAAEPPPIVLDHSAAADARRRRRPTSLSRSSRPRRCPDRRLPLRASRRMPRPSAAAASPRRLSSRRCVTFSPRA